MSTKKKLLEAAAGNAGEAVYVDDVFSTYLYDGNGSTQTITNSIDLAGEGGLVWTRWRSGYYTSRDHNLWDTERGTTGYLNTNNTAAEKTPYTNAITYNSNGFTLNNQFPSNMSFGSETFASWTFRKQPGFFDVVTYTGNGANRTIAHNLGSVPGMIIIKRLDNTSDWSVYHRGYGSGGPAGFLNNTDAAFNLSTYWNNTDPTSTDFSLGSFANVNTSGATYVAYLFAHDAQNFGTDSNEAIIKCGSYTGNSGNQTINVGFEAQWVLIKNTTSGSTDWFVVDTMRGMVDTGAVDAYLIRANESDAEQTSGAGGARITTRSTGFGFINESNLSCNRSGETYIYVAIRRPHKPAEEFAATDLFKVNNPDTAGDDAFESGFPVDMAIRRFVNVSDGPYLAARLGGPRYLLTSSTAAEVADASSVFDNNEGWASGWSSNTNHFSWMWRRAPGYFDVVAYTGTGGARALNHNLGAVPEMIWLKSRTNTAFWCVYHSAPGPTKYLQLSESTPETTQNTIWNDTAPTDTNFTVGAYINQSQDYIAYLFATVPGISKVGSYTGTAADLNVDCGFSAGARFVLIKRTDSTGDWYLWDSSRGIVAGNDPYLLANTNAAEITNTDYIDPLSSGFTVTSSAPAALNNSGGTYIFLAIA